MTVAVPNDMVIIMMIRIITKIKINHPLPKTIIEKPEILTH